MVATSLDGVLLPGDHASRPAAADVAKGALYACSDHDLIYQSNTSAWSTWATLGTAFDGTMAEIATPSPPSSGNARIYPKADGRFYSIDDAGVEYGPFDVGGGGGTDTADDDTFAGSTLGAWWLDPATSASGQTNVIDRFLELQGLTASKHFYGISQPAPAGDFTIKARLQQGQGGSDMRSGIYVAVNGAKGHVVGPFQQDGAAGALGVTTTSDTADWSGFDGFLATAAATITQWRWYKIIWDAGTSTFTFQVSAADADASYSTIATRGSMTQPDLMGLCLYSNSGAAGATSGGIRISRWIVTEP